MLRQTTSTVILLFGLLSASFAQAPKTEAPPAQPPRAAIKGRVLTEDGDALAGISITAIPFGRGAANRPAGPGGGGQVTQTTSDDEGYFEIAGLTPASYSLFAAVPGYITAPPDENHQTGLYHPGEGVTLTLIKGGIITGKVVNAAGEALTGVNVNAIRLGDGDAPAFTLPGNFNRPFRTDDLGVYRIYGLAPGNYIVEASGRGFGFGAPSALQEIPTYYPSAVREAAVPVAVYGGLEATGIDIRYRGERGYAVSGKVLAEKSNPASSGNADSGFAMTQVSLLAAGTDIVVASDRAMGGPMGRGPFGNTDGGFAFYGVADGEYDVVARRNGSDSEFISAPKRITVRSANVSGIELTLAPLASISGRVVLEKLNPPACRAPRLAYLSETLVRALRDDAKPAQPLQGNQRFVAPDQQGAFVLRGLAASRYRLETELPSPLWYLRAVQWEKAASVRKGAATADPVKDGLALKSGERMTGLVLTLAEGAANVQGKHKPKTAMYLIPAEKEAADDLLRYAQARTRDDGTFRFTNLAPGKYWLLAQPVPAQPSNPIWQTTARLNLRRLAETSGTLIELKPCQQFTTPASS